MERSGSQGKGVGYFLKDNNLPKQNNDVLGIVTIFVCCFICMSLA